MSEKIARTLRRDAGLLRRDITSGARRAVFRLVTPTIDRYQTVIDPQGVMLDEHKAAGSPFLWMHSSGDGFGPAPPPDVVIGRVVEYAQSAAALDITVEFRAPRNADDLAAYGSLNSAANSIRFMFSTDPAKSGDVERTAYQLKKFLLDVLRVDGDDNSTIKELLARAVGCEFVAQAHHRVDSERDTTFIDVKNWMPLD